MKFAFAKSACLTLAVISLGQTSLFAGCGIDWSLPKFRFDSVNEWGYVSYWERIGDVKMGKQDIPIHIHFLSNRKSSSPYAGYGWSVPLLESRMEQVSENGFKLWQPEGRYRDFGRDPENPNLLHGQAGWKAEIKGNRIQAYADCGWKLGFKDGRITSMGTPEGRSYRYQYENGRVKSIIEEGSGLTVLEVIRDPSDAGKMTLEMGEEKIVLEQGEKPRIERLMGQNLIGGMDQALVKIVRADGGGRELSYDVDPQNIVPTFTPQKGRKLTMDSTTDLISSDADWNYTVEQDRKVSWNNAAITRINGKQEKEFWFVDRVKGRMLVEEDGVNTIKTWFISGVVAGSTRKIEEIINGEKKIVYQATYDEKGNIVREFSRNDNKVEESFYNVRSGNLQKKTKGDVQIIYNNSGDPLVVKKMGKIRYKFDYDDEGRLIRHEDVGYREMRYHYVKNERLPYKVEEIFL